MPSSDEGGGVMGNELVVAHDPSARCAGTSPRFAWGGMALYDSATAGSPTPSRQANRRRKMTACTVAVIAVTP